MYAEAVVFGVGGGEKVEDGRGGGGGTAWRWSGSAVGYGNPVGGRGAQSGSRVAWLLNGTMAQCPSKSLGGAWEMGADGSTDHFTVGCGGSGDTGRRPAVDPPGAALAIGQLI